MQSRRVLNSRPWRRSGWCAVLAVLLVSPSAYGQDTRTEAINQERQDKQARLWPERESPLVRQANGLIERGFREGIEDGLGSNGFTPVLGGMRSGHGMSFGGAYRKTDIWGERIGVRGTARMTLQDAYMVDGRLDFHGLEFERGFFNLYGKYEHSPRMDFYGLGPFSSQDERSSYLLEDFSTDFRFGVELSDSWRVGFTGGGTLVYTGVGRRPGFPSTSDEFTLREAPGIGLGDLEFSRWGGFVAFDHRDTPSGTRRGGLFGLRWRRYWDHSRDLFNFKQADFEFQQFIPYYNESRVIAIRASATISWNDDDQFVPVFFMPTIGGNDDLRGFARYRYHDNHSVFYSVEHRWYVFRGLDMSAFVDAGKVIPRKADLDFSDLKVSGGVGFRTRLRDGVIMRTDFAYGDEGFRMIWTFSDIFKIDY